MKILPETRRRAFYDRFVQLLEYGRPVEMAQVEAAWADTGLRRSDLFNTLREMLADHLLLLDSDEGRHCLRLTQAGELDSERIGSQALAQLRDRWILWRAGVRPQRATRVPPRGRRREDRGLGGDESQSFRIT
jgi:hypothetical protein